MTGGGGAGTIAAAKFLKSKGRYRIILGDMDKWAAGLRFADKAYVLPSGKNINFLNSVKGIISKERVNIFIPLVDEEILKSYSLKKYFPDLKILLPEYNFTKIALDKWRMIKELKKNNLPCPDTYLYSRISKKLKFPLIVKPRIGRGSRNVMEINSLNQLRAYKIITNLPSESILIQEKIEGKEFTVSVVVNKVGNVLAVVPKEIIYKRGITIAAVTRKNKYIQDLCIEIQNKLHPNGPFNVQLILKNNCMPVIFEINPRYSTTIALTMASGVDEIELLIENKIFPRKILSFKENFVMTRFYDQLFFRER